MLVVSLGGGVQSTTILLMMEHGELPRADYAIFADTGWESQATYRHLEWLDSHVCIPIVRVQWSNIYEDVKSGRFVKMPVFIREGRNVSMLVRQCTEDYKVRPIKAHIRQQLSLHNEPVARLALGISLEEVHRMRDSDVKYIEHWYPLIEKRMRRVDCVIWLQSHGYPVPPKSSCLGCPFHKDSYWRELRQQSPEEFAQVIEIDRLIRHIPRVQGECFIHRTARPIEEAIDSTQQTLEFEECTGYCHT